MRARTVALIGIAAAGIALAPLLRSLARRAGRPTPPPAQIAPGVWCLGPWGRTQTCVYLVRSGEAWILVDAAWAGDADRIRSAVRVVAGPDAVPAAILLTHVHPDHSGAARALADAWGCPILLHRGEAAIARGDFAVMEATAGPLDRWVVLPILRAMGDERRAAVPTAGSLEGRFTTLGPGGMIPGLEDWTWVATPGHTPGHVALHRASDGVVISGDALVTLRVNELAGLLLGSNGLSGPPWYTTWDRNAAMDFIRTISALRPSVIGGGHGRPLTGARTAAAVVDLAEMQAERATCKTNHPAMAGIAMDPRRSSGS